MTDFDFVAEGKGVVVLTKNDDGTIASGMESEHIVVMSSGLVIYSMEDGTIGTMFGGEAIITELRWSVLEVNVVRDEPEPDCKRCGDDVGRRATMNPPVCPGCGKTGTGV